MTELDSTSQAGKPAPLSAGRGPAASLHACSDGSWDGEVVEQPGGLASLIPSFITSLDSRPQSQQGGASSAALEGLPAPSTAQAPSAGPVPRPEEQSPQPESQQSLDAAQAAAAIQEGLVAIEGSPACAPPAAAARAGAASGGAGGGEAATCAQPAAAGAVAAPAPVTAGALLMQAAPVAGSQGVLGTGMAGPLLQGVAGGSPQPGERVPAPPEPPAAALAPAEQRQQQGAGAEAAATRAGRLGVLGAAPEESLSIGGSAGRPAAEATPSQPHADLGTGAPGGPLDEPGSPSAAVTEPLSQAPALPAAPQPAAACSRGNLQLVLVTRNELARLIEVEQLVKGYFQAHGLQAGPSMPSVLRGLVVRFHAAKAYHLSRLLGTERDSEGRQQLLLQDGCHPRIPLVGVSNTNTSADAVAWAGQGQQEAAAFQDTMVAAGGLWSPEQVAEAAWRRKLAAAWFAFVAAIEGEHRQELPGLLGRLAEAGGLARQLARVELAGGGLWQPAGVQPQPADPGAAAQQQQQQDAMEVDKPAPAAAAPAVAAPTAVPTAMAAASGAGGAGAPVRTQVGEAGTPRQLGPALPRATQAAPVGASAANTPAAPPLLALPQPGLRVDSAFSAPLLDAAALPAGAALPPPLLRPLQQLPGPGGEPLQRVLAAPGGLLQGQSLLPPPAQQQQPAGGALETLQQMIAMAQRGAPPGFGSAQGGPAALNSRAGAAPAGLLPVGEEPGHDSAPAAEAGDAVAAAVAAAEFLASEELQAMASAAQRASPRSVGPPQQQAQHAKQHSAQQAERNAERRHPAVRERPHRQEQERPHRQEAGHQQDGGEASKRRRRQPITWQPSMESHPADRPLLDTRSSKPLPSLSRQPSTAAADARQPYPPAASAVAAAAAALSRQPSGQREPLTITRNFGGGEPEVHVNPAGLTAPPPPQQHHATAASAAAAGPGRASVEPDANVRVTVRVGEGAEGSASQGAAAAGLAAAGSTGDFVEQQLAAQHSALVGQLQQLAAALGGGEAGAAGAVAAVSGVMSQDLLQIPMYELISLYGAPLLQQQLAAAQQVLAAHLGAVPGGVGGPAEGGVLPPRRVSDAQGTGQEPRRGVVVYSEGAGMGSETRRVSDSARESSRSGRQVQFDSYGIDADGEAAVDLPGVRSVDEAVRHLERLCRAVIPSAARHSAVKRACLRELLLRGLRPGEAPGLFVQSGINLAQLGVIMIKAGRNSPQVAAEYEECGKNPLTHLLSDLARAGGVVERYKTRRGGDAVLLRVDLLPGLAGEGGSRRSGGGSGGGKRAHPGAEPEQPPAKQPRRDAALPPHAPGGGGGGREQLPRVAPASAATDRSSGSYADFWDPVWRYEHMLVRYLRKAGQVGMAELYQRFPLPAIFPEPHAWGQFEGFLLSRRHLFDVSGDLVGAVKGASALLEYKREMMEYLRHFPGTRANLERELLVAVPLPADTPSAVVREAHTNFWQFITSYFGHEVWLVAPKHYTRELYPLKTVELRPFFDPAPHPAAPRMRGLCKYFQPNRPGSCNKQDACDFSHCTERPLY